MRVYYKDYVYRPGGKNGSTDHSITLDLPNEEVVTTEYGLEYTLKGVTHLYPWGNIRSIEGWHASDPEWYEVKKRGSKTHTK